MRNKQKNSLKVYPLIIASVVMIWISHTLLGAVIDSENSSFSLWANATFGLSALFLLNITARKMRDTWEKPQIFEHAGSAMAILEEDNTISLANSRLERLTGYTKGEIEGTSWTKFVHPDDVKIMLGYYKKRRINGEGIPTKYEIRVLRKTGEIRNAVLEITMIPGTKKSVISLIDITEWKQMKKALLESEEKYRKLILQSAEAIYMADPVSKRILEANPAFLNYLGYTKEEMPSLTLYDFIAHSKESIDNYIQKILEAGTFTVGERKWRRKDGKLIDVRISGGKIEQPEKTILFVMATDITEQKRMEEEIINYQKKIKSLINSSSDFISLKDRNFRYLIANKTYEKFFNIKVEDILGKTCFDFMPKAAAEQERKGDIKALESGFFSGEEFIGKKWLHVVKQRVVDTKGEIIGIADVTRDITERKKIENMKSEFIGTVSHELRTPLTAISGFVKLILDGKPGPLTPPQREFLEIIQRNTQRLNALIGDLLDVEKIESGKVKLSKELLDISEIVKSVSKTFKVTAGEKGLTLETNIEKKPLYVVGDRDRLIQLFSNLASNAIKYTKEGGVTIRAKMEREEAIIEVEDTGVGLKPEDKEKLFQRFFRTKDAYTQAIEGTGLGLSIAKGIVELHNGKIEVESEYHKGSIFRVRLPVAHTHTEGKTLPNVRYIEPEKGSKGKILIIDDDRGITRLISEYMLREGYSVTRCSNGESGILSALSNPPDLITLDIRMERMDGWEVITHLKMNPKTKNIPVIIISVVEEEEKAYRLGASAFLGKPINENLLKQVVNILTEGTEHPILLVDDDPEYVKETSKILERSGFKVTTKSNVTEARKIILNQSFPLLILDQALPDGCGLALIDEIRKKPNPNRDTPIILISGVPGAKYYEQEVEMYKDTIFLPKRFTPDEIVGRIIKILVRRENLKQKEEKVA